MGRVYFSKRRAVSTFGCLWRRKRSLRLSVVATVFGLLLPCVFWYGKRNTSNKGVLRVSNRNGRLTILQDELDGYYKRHPPNAATSSEYVLYRALGNDLPPRHEQGQTYRNLEFILANEGKHQGLDTRWYVNRIINVTEVRRIVELLMRYNETFYVDVFDVEEYAKVDIRLQGLNESSEEDVLHSDRFRGMSEKERAFLMDAVLHDQNQFLIHNNHARNAMVKLGLEAGAEYVLPWDGNCFLNQKAWMQIRGGIKKVIENDDKTTSRKYFTVPMARMTSNEVLMDDSFEPTEAKEEPQIIFHRSAKERFNENMRYGRRPKVELFWRLQVAGPWDKWPQSGGVWEKQTWTKSDDVAGKNSVKSVGWVARLFSGVSGLEQKGVMGKRGVSRSGGIELILAKGKEIWAREKLGFGKRLMLFNETALGNNRRRYKNGDKKIRGIVTRLESAANRVREEEEEEEFKHVADNVVILTLCGYMTEKREYLQRAVKLLRTKVLSDDISIANGGASMEGASISYLLDAVRLLQQSGTIGRTFIQQLQQKLDPSQPTSNTDGYFTYGTNGILYDVYAASVHAFVGDFRMFLRHSSVARGRLLQQWDVNTSTIVGWTLLAEIGYAAGIDVWGFKRHGERESILGNAVRLFVQGNERDIDAVYYVARLRTKQADMKRDTIKGGGSVGLPALLETRDVPFGLPPFWKLGIGE